MGIFKRGTMIKYNKKGFTLTELLIVCAIIGILVAISIPIFNNQMEKAREAHDLITMRTAASAAIDLYYAGVHDRPSAEAAGMNWNDGSSSAGVAKIVTANAFGAYDPKTGKFYKSRDDLPQGSKAYGKGTKQDGGTTFPSANPNGSYCSTEDYRDAVVMVSIYPNTDPARVDVYWKNNRGKDKGHYVGGYSIINVPKYSLRYILG